MARKSKEKEVPAGRYRRRDLVAEDANAQGFFSENKVSNAIKQLYRRYITRTKS